MCSFHLSLIWGLCRLEKTPYPCPSVQTDRTHKDVCNVHWVICLDACRVSPFHVLKTSLHKEKPFRKSHHRMIKKGFHFQENAKMDCNCDVVDQLATTVDCRKHHTIALESKCIFVWKAYLHFPWNEHWHMTWIMRLLYGNCSNNSYLWGFRFRDICSLMLW